MSKPATTNSTPHSNSKLSLLGMNATIWTVDALIRSLFASLKIDYIGRDQLDALHAEGQGYILAIWHCNVLLSPIIHRGLGIMVMVSMSRDGDIISGVVERMGNIPVRGSSSREGRRALSQMIRSLEAGGSAAITPDGPLGPYMKLKSGVVAMAQSAGVPIIPCHYEVDRCWQMSSWDRQVVPKPFANLTVRYGTPMTVAPDLPPEEFDAEVIRVERQILANVRACRALAADR